MIQTAKVLVLLAAIGLPASAQSLADAARLAEEQRKAETRPSVQIRTAPNFIFREIRLDDGIVSKFVNAREALTRLFARDRVLYDTIREGAKSIERFRDFAKVLAIEPKVVDGLSFFGFDPDSFVLTEVTLRRSLRRSEDAVPAGTDIERENSAYADKNRTRMSFQYAYWQKLDAGRWFWPETVLYW